MSHGLSRHSLQLVCRLNCMVRRCNQTARCRHCTKNAAAAGLAWRRWEEHFQKRKVRGVWPCKCERASMLLGCAGHVDPSLHPCLPQAILFSTTPHSPPVRQPSPAQKFQVRSWSLQISRQIVMTLSILTSPIKARHHATTTERPCALTYPHSHKHQPSKLPRPMQMLQIERQSMFACLHP